MNQLSLLPTDPPGDALTGPSRSQSVQGALNAAARASDEPEVRQGALEDMLTALPEVL